MTTALPHAGHPDAAAHSRGHHRGERPRPLGRILSVIRLQYVNRGPFLLVPLIVFGSAVVLSFAIYAMVDAPTHIYGGGAQAPMWTFLFVGVSAITLTFPFSQALGLTRREFFFGSIASALIGAMALATALVIVGALERETDGFGTDGFLAYLPWLWEAGWWSAWLSFTTLTVLAFVLGFWAATVLKRWGMTVLVAALCALGFVLLGIAFILTRGEHWPAVISWFAQAGALQLTGWLALLTAVLAGLSYLTLRRAVP